MRCSMRVPLPFLVLALLWTGCGDDPIRPLQSTPRVATSADELVEFLSEAWNSPSEQRLTGILHPDFVFVLPENEDLGFVEWGTNQETWVMRQLEASHAAAQDNPADDRVVSVVIDLIAQAVWSPSDDARFPGTSTRIYYVDGQVTYSNGDVDNVSGLQRLFALPPDDDSEDGFQLLAWQDLGRDEVKGTRNVSWSKLKTLYAYQLPDGVATSALDVWTQLERALTERDMDAYERLLLDDFTFTFAPADVGTSREDLTRAAEVDIMSRVLGGSFGFDSNGDFQPSIGSLEVQLTLLPTPANITGAYVQLDGAASYAGGTSDTWSRRQHISPVSEQVETTEGFQYTRWQIKSWSEFDAGAGKAQVSSWGSLKLAYEFADPQPYPTADSPDILVQNFVKAWNERNGLEYERLLDGEFVFFFAPQEVEDIGHGSFWDRSRELQSVDKMFNSQPGTRPDGGLQDPVHTINLELISQSSAWSPEVPDEFSGTVGKTFEVAMSVTYTNGDISEVSGLQEFYVSQAEETIGTETKTVFRLKFWRDLGRDEVKATTTDSWGAVKGRF